MSEEDVVITSLLPDAFVSGRWSGGRGTVTEVHYEYRKVQGQKGPFTVVETHLSIEDANGDEHKGIRYGAGFADSACIRSEPSEDSPEAEVGFGLSGRNGKKFELRQDTETAMLLVSAYTNGLPASRVGNDIRGLVGMDADWVEKPHQGVKDDKYPMLLVTQVYSAGAGVGAKKKKRRDDDDDADASPKSKKRSPADDADDEKPKSAKSGSSNGSSALEKRARKFVVSAANANDGTTTTGDVARAAAKKLKAEVEDGDMTKDDRKAIIEMLGDDDWYAAQPELWKFKAKTGEVILVEAD